MNTLTAALLTAVASGALAMIGAYWGAALSRRTEYEKWFRQEKSKAFAELLSELHNTRLASADAMYDPAVPENQREMRATELFAKLRKYEAIARLYMSESNRSELEQGISALWLATATKGGPANHAIKIKEQMESIQLLLERELHASPSMLGNKPRA